MHVVCSSTYAIPVGNMNKISEKTTKHQWCEPERHYDKHHQQYQIMSLLLSSVKSGVTVAAAVGISVYNVFRILCRSSPSSTGAGVRSIAAATGSVCSRREASSAILFASNHPPLERLDAAAKSDTFVSTTLTSKDGNSRFLVLHKLQPLWRTLPDREPETRDTLQATSSTVAAGSTSTSESKGVDSDTPQSSSHDTVGIEPIWLSFDELPPSVQAGLSLEDRQTVAHDRQSRHTYVILGRDVIPHVHTSESVAVSDSSAARSKKVLCAIAVDDEEASWILENTQNGEFLSMRSVLPRVQHRDGAVTALAHSMIAWHSGNLYCATCGARSVSIDGGWKRRCSSKLAVSTADPPDDSKSKSAQSKKASRCHDQYPRLDPVAIVAVSSIDNKRLLLGRKANWPKNRFSCVAGFISAGETIEDAARREVLEETGIAVGRVQYHSSQPWPFLGAQLMIGCIGFANHHNISLENDEELESAQWFTKQEILAGLANSFQTQHASFLSDEATQLTLPSSYAIAHHLAQFWCDNIAQE
jgi:NADH pyrophosphatase NudC (nudix superfamily)